MTKNIVEEVKRMFSKEDVPEVKVKFEKKDRGLYERTSDNTILITEDNKMMLND